jgi:ParB family chromosome partitioning protein
MPLQLEVLDEPVMLGAEAAGTPLQLAVDSIDEDPEQPRLEFDAETLKELAATVTERGVREPISVRPHPSEEGRWIINSGARRLRATKLAGKAAIPAFVDVTADSYDQVIENEQRDNLTPMDLAMFVQRRLGIGETQTEIARRLGKSQSYVAFACALIDAPEWLMDLYRKNKCRGIRELYELRRLHGQSPECVDEWMKQKNCITRTDVQELKSDLEARRVDRLPQEQDANSGAAACEALRSATVAGGGATTAKGARSAHKRPALLARHEGSVVEIVFSDVPDVPGNVFVRAQGSLDKTCVAAGHLELLGFVSPGGIDGQ